MDRQEFGYNLLKIHLPLLAVQFLFASLPAYSKLTFQSFSPESVTWFRIVLVALLFSAIFFTSRKEKIKEKKHYLFFALYALFGVVGNQYLFLKGVQFSTAINASLLISVIPIFTMITAVVLGKEIFSKLRFGGVLIALLGVLYLLGVSNLQFDDYFSGNIMIITNALFYSIYLVISKPMLEIYKPFTLITYVFIFAAIEIFPLTFGDVLQVNYSFLELYDYYPLLVVLIFGTLLPYLINIFALKRANSTLVAVYVYLQPVIGAVLAILVLGEEITTKVIISSVLIFVGLSVVSFQDKIRKSFNRWKSPQNVEIK
ncbi:MAG: DMT family transporter [Rhodothermaceae bacterium]